VTRYARLQVSRTVVIALGSLESPALVHAKLSLVSASLSFLTEIEPETAVFNLF